MAFHSYCENNGDKENIPISSAKPVVAVSKLPSHKTKSRSPLEDITNLYQESSFVVNFDAHSLFFLAILVHQIEKIRFKKSETAKSRNSAAAAATLRKHYRYAIVARPVKPITVFRRALEVQFEKMNQSKNYWPVRVSPGGPDGHHHLKHL